MIDRFYETVAQIATPSSLKHFRQSLEDYLQSCIVEGEHRENKTSFTIEELRKLRRENMGIRPLYFPFEMYLNIPDDVINHPVIKEIEYLIIDMIGIDNVSHRIILPSPAKDPFLSQVIN